MGKKSSLSEIEKQQIVSLMSKNNSTLIISKILGRDHRTVKSFAENCQKKRRIPKRKHLRILTPKDLRKLKFFHFPQI